ncbi:ATP-binding protein [Acetoanaerobium noterae]|uniref:ATP-binding protein n=1 Tax=Acetoanaerobium noterae TaxID=745369 RepID=UPI0033419AF6
MNSKIYKNNEYIDWALTHLKLQDLKENYENEINFAIENNIGYRNFLLNILKVEEEGRNNRLIDRNMKAARFENFKTIESFDFNFQKSINIDKIKDLHNLSFLNKKENIILIGPPGVGKMSIYQKKGDLKKLFKSLSKINLLIIDEMGHLVLDKEKESMIFQLIRQRYEKNSLIITTNLPLGEWDKIFTSILSATAVLDRLVHHCHVISIPGDSYRVKRKQKEM